MKRILKTLLPICLLTALAALAISAPANAEPPCWKTLINDWYDGQIDGIYPVPCYQQAIDHLPVDVKDYSNAADSIKLALEVRIARLKNGGPTGPHGNGSTPTTTGRNKPSGPIPGAINAGSGNHADSVPIPLIVLAAIAGLLLIAGTAGFIARRVQARKTPLPPGGAAPESPPQT